MPRSSPEPRIAVLIPCHNGAPTLPSTIASATPQADVFLVDDGSTDSTAAVARASGAHVLELPENIGKARAIRRALDHHWAELDGARLVETYTHICIVDDDVILSASYLAHMSERARDPRVAIAEGWSETYWPESRKWNVWIAARALVTWRLQLITIPLQAAVGTRAWLTGAHAVYRSDVIDQISRDDPVFVVEDCDFLWQVQRDHLGSVVFVRRARAMWQQAASWRDLHEQHCRWYKGTWQTLLHHGLGTRRTRHDAWFALWTFELMFHTIWPLIAIGLWLIGGISMWPLVICMAVFYVMTAVVGAIALRRWRLLVLWPWEVAYDFLWRYFSFRGLITAWREPTAVTGTWASPRRSVG